MPSSKSDPKTKKKKHCENCGQELDEDKTYELDGMILCWDCYNEEEDLRGVEEENARALLVSVDEIEKAGELPYQKGRETLSLIRDFINILTSEDSLPIKRGAMKGLFICYAISTFYLGYSGVIEVEGVDFKAHADQYGRPKVTIQEVPRLSTMLRESGSMVSADFSGIQDIERIAQKIIPCYACAKGKNISINADVLAKEAFNLTNEFLARSNVMAMVKHLDKL